MAFIAVEFSAFLVNFLVLMHGFFDSKAAKFSPFKLKSRVLV